MSVCLKCVDIYKVKICTKEIVQVYKIKLSKSTKISETTTTITITPFFTEIMYSHTAISFLLFGKEVELTHNVTHCWSLVGVLLHT